ncbi:MAG: hypothetical protein ACXABY_02265 [Candidatus Thorarchaeota archaeon]|jgi:hypothetical protein
MGQQYRENWKRTAGKNPASADSADDLLRFEDGLSSISGSIVGAGGTSVVANALSQLEISSSGDGTGITVAAVTGIMVGDGTVSVFASGAALVINGTPGGSETLTQTLGFGNTTSGSSIVLTSGDAINIVDENGAVYGAIRASGSSILVDDGSGGIIDFTTFGTFDSRGRTFFLGTARVFSFGASTLQFTQRDGSSAFTLECNTIRDSSNDVQMGPNGLALSNDAYIEFSQGAGATSSPKDIRAARLSPGLIEITNPNTSVRGSVVASGVSRRIHINTVSSGNVGAAEQTLMTFALPANSLDSDGAGVDIKAWGVWGTNSGARDAKLWMDGFETCKATADATSNSRAWEINVSAIRINSTTLEIIGRAETFGNASNTYILRQRPNTFTLSSSFDIEVVCENNVDSANDEIVAHGFTVTLIPAT